MNRDEINHGKTPNPNTKSMVIIIMLCLLISYYMASMTLIGLILLVIENLHVLMLSILVVTLSLESLVRRK
jgi:hypothetical protein